ncbi:MAG: phospholipase A [Burkholderiaceae bacterium]
MPSPDLALPTTFAAGLLASCLSATALAQTSDAPTLESCAAIGASTDRLACYDKLAGRAAAPVVPPAQEALPVAATPPSTSLLAPTGATLPETAAPKEQTTLMSKYWELEPADKRGIFNFVGFRPNYVMPIHITSRINRTPQSPTQAPVSLPDYKREEAKFQLSLRTKLAQDVLLPEADLWVAFSQQVMWQVWNGKDSKPFRNTDFEPEVIYLVPTPKSWRELPLGWQWRYTQFGLAHQSNGQSDPLSRSWNRVYIGTGFERGDWGLTARLTQRLNEPLATDNNPDLQTYRGRGEFQLNWAHGVQTASLLYRNTLKGLKYGALQFEWTYPIYKDQPNGLRWFVQAFRGYGETLTDYNFRQTSFGAGVTFLQF